ncbi:MAG: YggT family protein [Candidatus Margulisiibacteriota bacterium]
MDLAIFAINFVFAFYYILVLVRILLPFVPHNRQHPLIKPIFDLTDPILTPIRQGLPPMKFGYDVAPFIVILMLAILQRLVLYVIGGF